MNATIYQPEPVCIDILSDATWNALGLQLLPLALSWVYRAGVASWRGQESDIAGDVVQEALRKTFQYALNAQQHGIAITSLERLCMVIAKNQLRDQRRKDSRLLHIERDADSPEAENAIFYEEEDPAEQILEGLYDEWVFREVAKVVVLFPEKMRLAVLLDIARRMQAQGEFGGEPSPLRQAFLNEGVRLEEYVDLLPADPDARARQSSLVSLGFKRIAKLVSMKLNSHQCSYAGQ
jgi:DNA-directed RNA polymerase specialized sigma24 family protein